MMLKLFYGKMFSEKVKVATYRIIWVKVFESRSSKICKRQPLINLADHYHFKFFKGCLPQILLGPFLNTLTYINHLYKANCIFSITKQIK